MPIWDPQSEFPEFPGSAVFLAFLYSLIGNPEFPPEISGISLERAFGIPKSRFWGKMKLIRWAVMTYSGLRKEMFFFLISELCSWKNIHTRRIHRNRGFSRSWNFLMKSPGFGRTSAANSEKIRMESAFCLFRFKILVCQNDRCLGVLGVLHLNTPVLYVLSILSLFWTSISLEQIFSDDHDHMCCGFSWGNLGHGYRSSPA